MTFTRRFPKAILLFAVLFLLQLVAFAAEPSRRAVLMISIDGMRPEYVADADQYGLKIPVLRRLYSSGAHATGVRGVMPTVTYPSHTALITGVSPRKHGIFNNATFDPEGRNAGGWFWYAQDIRVPTLWEVAAKNGYTVGSVGWPVSVDAIGVKYDVPEYWRTTTSDDRKLLAAISTPGLLKELEAKVEPPVINFDDAVHGDWVRSRYAEVLIRDKHANFITLHIAALDHLEHVNGPFTPPALTALEAIDSMIGELEQTLQKQNRDYAIAIVSDHGFAKVEHQLNPAVEFVKAGLITPNPKKTGWNGPTVTAWKAQVWSASGSAYIMLKDPNDKETAGKVATILRDLAADPNNGIARVLTHDQIVELGGNPDAQFALDMKPGYRVEGSLDGPLLRAGSGGTHGYLPTYPEMRASFILAGPAIQHGLDLGQIDMRNIAPTIGGVMGFSFSTADMPALNVLAK